LGDFYRAEFGSGFGGRWNGAGRDGKIVPNPPLFGIRPARERETLDPTFLYRSEER
jgi:hypothetical protein